MSNSIQTPRISTLEKIATITMLVTLCGALMVPVSQAARNRELEVQRNRIAHQVTRIEEETRMIEALLAEARLPEATLRQSVLHGITLEKVLFEQTKIVVMEE